MIEAGPAYVGVLAALHRASFDAPGEQPWDEAAMASLLAGRGVFALIDGLDGDDGEPAGLVLCRVAADEAEVLTIGVAPAGRRRGTGGRLLDAAMARSRAAGARMLFLEVAEDNLAALALYGRRGFIAVARRVRYYHHGGDALVLRADLERPIS